MINYPHYTVDYNSIGKNWLARHWDLNYPYVAKGKFFSTKTTAWLHIFFFKTKGFK